MKLKDLSPVNSVLVKHNGLKTIMLNFMGDDYNYKVVIVAEVKGKYNRFYGLVKEILDVEDIIKSFGNKCSWDVKIYNIKYNDVKRMDNFCKTEKELLSTLITSGYDYHYEYFRSMTGSSKIFISNLIRGLRYRRKNTD